jgi:serine/threonine protein phosphatase PrpC
MGGYEHGRWASQVIIRAIERVELGAGDLRANCLALADAVHDANEVIFREAEGRGSQMGSTVAAIVFEGVGFGVLWAGDSRVYLLRDGGLHRLTRDHTRVQAMVDSGSLTPEEALHHPMGHILSRAVGIGDDLELDVFTDETAVGDSFLLCSDGLHGVVSDHEIRDCLGVGSPSVACERLLSLALERGGPDNVTIIVICCEEQTRVTFAVGEGQA